jgi:hypothetical protein
MGYPAARISVAIENYDWQHQDLRTENGKRYGDTIDHVDFAYLAKMTKLNVAALASIASAPPPPDPKVEGAVSTDTTVSWIVEPGRRRTKSGGVEQTRATGRSRANLGRDLRSLLDAILATAGLRDSTLISGSSFSHTSASTTGCSASRR